MKRAYFFLILLSYTHFGLATEAINETETTTTEISETEPRIQNPPSCLLADPPSVISPFLTTLLITGISEDSTDKTSHKNKAILRAKLDAMTYIASNEEISSPWLENVFQQLRAEYPAYEKMALAKAIAALSIEIP